MKQGKYTLNMESKISCMYIKVVYEDIWKEFVMDAYFKGNHCSWLKPMGYTFHFSTESFPIHFQQHALLQFQIHTSLRTSSIMFIKLFQYPCLAMKMSSYLYLNYRASSLKCLLEFFVTVPKCWSSLTSSVLTKLRIAELTKINSSLSLDFLLIKCALYPNPRLVEQMWNDLLTRLQVIPHLRL